MSTTSSWINATHRNKGRWVEQGSRPDLKGRERHVPKVNTFALLCEDRLICWDLPDGDGQKGGVTQAQFQQFFKQHVGPQLVNLKSWAKGREVRLMLDGAATHGVKELDAWAKKHSVSLIEGWPSHSPDLNRITLLDTSTAITPPVCRLPNSGPEPRRREDRQCRGVTGSTTCIRHAVCQPHLEYAGLQPGTVVPS